MVAVAPHHWFVQPLLAFSIPLVWAIVLSVPKAMREACQLDKANIVPTPYFLFLLTADFWELGGIIFIMGKIAYHLKGADVVSIAFNAENLKGDELNGKIAIRILESLKAQNALDMVVFTDENNETINLI